MSIVAALAAVKELGDIAPDVAAAFALGFVAGNVRSPLLLSFYWQHSLFSLGVLASPLAIDDDNISYNDTTSRLRLFAG